MSKTIDQRVVEMQFDNGHFERNVNTSMNTLDRLKQSLKFDGVSKGFDGISNAANKCDMSGLLNGVGAVSSKFSSFEVIALTALMNITNSAVDAGKKLVMSLSVDQITSGWSKYGQKTASVQTIMNSTGKSIDEVNSYLDKLMWFSDETSYGFTDMTAALAQMTSSGGKIENLIPLITGVANATAFAGKGASAFSHAMYNLNQSYGAGYLQLMDWKSFELAGVGSKQLKQTLIDVGVELGKIKEGQVSLGTFSESLKDKWADTEVMEKAFGRFSELSDAAYEAVNNGEYETAAEAIEALSGNYSELASSAFKSAQEAKTFAEAIEATKDAVSSGWMKTFEIIFGDYEEAKVMWTDLANTLWDLFASGAESRNEMLQGWKDLGGRTDLIDSLKIAFEGLMNIIDPIKEAFTDIFPPITSEQLAGFTSGLKTLTEKFREITERYAPDIKSTFKGIFAVVDIVATVILKVASGIVTLISSIFGLSDGVVGLTGSFGDWLVSLRDSIKETGIIGTTIDKVFGFLQKCIEKFKQFISVVSEKFVSPGLEGFLNLLTKIWDVAKSIGSKIGSVISSITSSISNAFRNGTVNGLIDMANGGIFASILIGIKKFITGSTEAVDNASNILSSVTRVLKEIPKDVANILNEVRGCLEAYQQNIKAKTLLMIAGAVAILAASLTLIASIDSAKLTSSLGAITVLFADLLGAMTLFDKINGKFRGMERSIAGMIGMSTAVLILASALKKLGSLNWEELARGLVGVIGLTAVVISAAKILSNGKKAIIKGASHMVVMAIAINILGSALKKVATLNWEELARGLVGITAVAGILVASAKIMSTDGKKLTKGAGQMLVMTMALSLMASSLKRLSSLSWKELAVGLTGITVALGVLVGAAKIMETDGKKLTKGAGQILVMSISLTIMAGAIKMISSLNWEELARGLVGITGVLAAIVGALAILSTFKGSAVVGAVAIAAMAVSINILVPPLILLGSMSWESIAKGLVTLAGAFTVLGVAAAIFTASGLLVAIIGLSASVALIGVGCMAAGAGLLAIAAGITALATALSAGATVIMAGISVIVNGLVQLSEDIIVGICKGIANKADAIGEALVALVTLAIDVICVKCVTMIADGLLRLFSSVLDSLVKYTPKIVDSLFQFFVGIIEGIGRNLPKLIKSIVDLIMSLYQGIIDALSGVDINVILEGIKGIWLLSGLIASLASVAVLSPMAMVGVIGMGAVISELGVVLSAIGALAQIPGLKWFISEGGNLLQTIGTSIGQFIGGIVGGIGRGITSSLPQIGSDLSDFMKNVMPFVAGANYISSSTFDGIDALAGVILKLTAADVISGLTSWFTGGSSLAKFGEELSKFGPHFKMYYDSIKDVNTDVITSSANAASALTELASNIPNSGGLVSLISGDNSIANFGDGLTKLGEGLKGYSDAITEGNGFNPDAVVSSANAAKALTELASNVPNSGGIVSWFAGDNSVANFGDELKKLGEGLRGYSDAITEGDGFNTEAVSASTNAAKSLVELTNNLPNSGGMITWFTGDNSVANFGSDLIALGKGLRLYSEEITSGNGFNPEAVIASANAAQALTQLASTVPDSGGMMTWFSGDNSIATFGKQLVMLGAGLRLYSEEITSGNGFNPEAVTASANAATALTQLASTVPNSGGLMSWFTGEQSISTFGLQLVTLGKSLKSYSDSITEGNGFNPEAVTASANAAQSLSSLVSNLPELGGLQAIFSGDKSLSAFAIGLAPFAQGMKSYSDIITEGNGFNPDAVVASANAAKSIVELYNNLPEIGGLQSLFSGEQSLGLFAQQLAPFGAGMKAYSDSLIGEGNPFNAEVVTASASAAQALAGLASNLPDEGLLSRLIGLFSNEGSLTSLASQLPAFGSAMRSYSDALGTEFSSDSVIASANAGKALGELATNLQGGVIEQLISLFSSDSGDGSIFAKLSNGLPEFGSAMRSYSDALGTEFSAENVTASANAAKSLAELSAYLGGGVLDKIIAAFSSDSGGTLSTFSADLVTFGSAMKAYSEAIGKDFSAENVTASANAGKALAELANNIPRGGWEQIVKGSETLPQFGEDLKSFSASLSEFDASRVTSTINSLKEISEVSFEDLANASIDNFVNAFDGVEQKVIDVANKMIDSFAKAISTDSNKSVIASELQTVASNAATEVQNSSVYDNFKAAGAHLAQGFADGIKSNSFAAQAQAAAMAKAAYESAKQVLDINSPSKVFRKLGTCIPEGFAMGIDKLGGDVKKSSVEMAKTAINGTSDAIRRVADLINSDIDAQPVIRPVIDLDDVVTGANDISSLLSMTPSVGIMSNLRSIGSMMENQNGANDDIVSAIKDLKKTLSNVSGDTYSINGITYDDGSSISDAVQTLVRAAIMERRR